MEGIVSPRNRQYPVYENVAQDNSNRLRGDSQEETAFAPIYDTPADGGGTSGAASRNAPVTINVTLTPSFSFSNTGGESDGKTESFIRRCMKESADDLADELAERLIAVFENSPRR